MIDVADYIKPAMLDGLHSASIIDVEPTIRVQPYCLKADIVGALPVTKSTSSKSNSLSSSNSRTT